LRRWDRAINPAGRIGALVVVHLVLGKVRFEPTLRTCNDDLFLVATALSEHAQLQATNGAVMVPPRGLVSTPIVIFCVFPLLEGHNNIRRIYNGVMFQIFVLVVQPTLSQGSYTTRRNLLRGDEAEQIKEVHALFDERVSRLEWISIPSVDFMEEGEPIFTDANHFYFSNLREEL
jgi:hypothetical protein